MVEVRLEDHRPLLAGEVESSLREKMPGPSVTV